MLDAQNILIDKLGLSPGLEGGSDLTLCDSCHTCLCEKKKLPPAALANHRWIGDDRGQRRTGGVHRTARAVCDLVFVEHD